MRGRAPRWRCVVAAVSTLLAITALAANLNWSNIFDSVLASQVALTPTSRSFREWLAPTVPIFFDVYLFNWTNADKFPGEVPRLEQLGPYRFEERRRHVNITWHPHNGSLAYRTHRSWHFHHSSNGSLDDNITTLNIIAASAVYRSRDWSFLRQQGLSLGLTMFGQGIAVSKLAKELLFEGYEDPLLDLAKSLPSSATGGAPPVDRFGLFYGRNNSIDTDGYMEVTTGQESGTLPGQVLRWNYEDSLQYYSGDCAKLSGSAGEFLPRDLTEDSQLWMFVADLCRTVQMDYVDSGELAGLEYYKYAFSANSFDNSNTSDHTCFCNGDCSWSGVMNVSACRFGSPAFLTLPHFLYADPELMQLVDGMLPDPDKHSFYFSVEPKLGVPLDVAARFQFNIFIESSPNVALYASVPRMLFPIMWVEQHVTIEDRVCEELRYARAILNWGPTVCASAAVLFTLIVAIAIWFTKPAQPKVTVDKPKDEAEMKLNPT